MSPWQILMVVWLAGCVLLVLVLLVAYWWPRRDRDHRVAERGDDAD